MNLRTFITAGNATFTVTSRKSGTRFTYRVSATDRPGSWFVSVLTGPDNTSDFSYAGLMTEHAGVLHCRQTRGSKVGPTAPSWLGFVWLLSRIHRPALLEQQAEIHHEGRCGRCGRALTVPESIESGFGPECINKVA